MFKAQSADDELDDNIVNVDVYYESLCSDSMRWFANQLVPSYKELKNSLNVTLVPFGKATVSNYNYVILRDLYRFSMK